PSLSSLFPYTTLFRSPSVTFFEMPVQVRFFGAGGQTFDATLDHTVSGQQFTVTVPFEVVDIAVDPEQHIISRNNTASLGIAKTRSEEHTSELQSRENL